MIFQIGLKTMSLSFVSKLWTFIVFKRFFSILDFRNKTTNIQFVISIPKRVVHNITTEIRTSGCKMEGADESNGLPIDACQHGHAIDMIWSFRRGQQRLASTSSTHPRLIFCLCTLSNERTNELSGSLLETFCCLLRNNNNSSSNNDDDSNSSSIIVVVIVSPIWANKFWAMMPRFGVGSSNFSSHLSFRESVTRGDVSF